MIKKTELRCTSDFKPSYVIIAMIIRMTSGQPVSRDLIVSRSVQLET